MILTEGNNPQVVCLEQMLPIRDALEIVGGKWKILILTAIMQGNHRFKEIERSIPKISPKVLAKELKDMEMHQLIKRVVHEEYPVRIEYLATEHALSLKKVMLELHAWGIAHHQKMFGK